MNSEKQTAKREISLKSAAERETGNKENPRGFLPIEVRIKVSVVIAVYNGEKYLQQCMDSILAQSLHEIEIICVNDGSTDSTPSILESYARIDSRVKVFHIPNGGAGAARNFGMHYARGQYLSFLDADDFFEKSMLKKAYDKAVQFDCDIVLFGCDLYDQQTNRLSKAAWTVKKNYLPNKNPFNRNDIPEYIFSFTVGWAWDKLFKNDFVRRNGLKFLEQNIFEDTYFTCLACSLANQIYYLDEVLAHYRTNTSTSLSSSKGKYVDLIPNSFRSIRNRLEQEGLYAQLEKGFVNRLIEALFDVFLNTEGEPRERLYNQIKDMYLKEFAISGREDSFFFRPHIAQFVHDVEQNSYVDYLSIRLVRVERNYKKAVEEKNELERRLRYQFTLEENRQRENRDELLAQKIGNSLIKFYVLAKKAFRYYKANGLKVTLKRILCGKRAFYARDINICFVTDDGFSMPTSVTIASILKNRSKRYNYNIYIIGYNLSSDSVKKLSSIQAKNFQVRVINAPELDLLKKYNFVSTTVHVTPTSILKFFIPQYLSAVDKVLYLDGDIVVQSNLAELYNIDIHDRYAAVVKDIVSTFAWHRQEVPYGSSYYFNSGMMLLNLSKMRSENVSERLIDYRIHGKNYYMDQDALNVAFAGCVRFISPYFNFINKFLYQKGADWMSQFYHVIIHRNEVRAFQKAQIIHFASQKKPWYSELPYLTKLFKKYYALSPYKDIPLYTSTPAEYSAFHKINKLNDYWNMLMQRRDEFVLVMAIKDDASVFWNKIEFPQSVKNTSLHPHFRNGYAYIRDFSEDYFEEKIGRNYAELCYEGKEAYVSVKSQGAEQGKKPYFEIVITPKGFPNIKITKNKHRGLNVVVYSKKCRRVIDDFSVDVFKDAELNIDRS